MLEEDLSSPRVNPEPLRALPAFVSVAVRLLWCPKIRMPGKAIQGRGGKESHWALGAVDCSALWELGLGTGEAVSL